MALTERAGCWKSLVALCVCFILLVSWSPLADAGPVKEVKRDTWKLPDEYKYDSDLTEEDSKNRGDYSGLDKQKLVQLIAKLILERKGLAQPNNNKIYDDAIQPAKRQRSLFAGDRGGWGGGYGK